MVCVSHYISNGRVKEKKLFVRSIREFKALSKEDEDGFV